MIEGAREVLEQSKSLVVKSPITRKQAADIWDAVVAFRKQSEAQKEEVCRPLKTAWDNAKKPFDTFKKECEEAEARMTRAMAEWDAEQDRLAREEQRKIQAKIDAENAKKLTKAEAKGQDVSEVTLKVAPVVQAPPKAIETQAGTTQQRIEKTVFGIKGIVTDSTVKADDPTPTVVALLAKFPALFELNWVAFRKLASTGMLDNVPGVEKKIEYIYQQRSK